MDSVVRPPWYSPRPQTSHQTAVVFSQGGIKDAGCCTIENETIPSFLRASRLKGAMKGSSCFAIRLPCISWMRSSFLLLSFLFISCSSLCEDGSGKISFDEFQEYVPELQNASEFNLTFLEFLLGISS